MHRPASFDEPLEGQWPLFQAPPPQPADFEVRRGDVFALGDACRLMCGDATRREDVAKLFAGQRPTLVVTSPPYADCRDYNDPIPCWDTLMLGAFDGHDFADDVQILINLGVIHRKNEYVSYSDQFIANMRKKQWRHYGLYIWDKHLVAPGKFYGRLPPSFEYIHHINKKTSDANKWVPCRDNCVSRQGSKGGSNIVKKSGASDRRSRHITHTHKVPRNIISIPPVRQKEASGHPAQMPIALAAFLIRTWRKDGCVAYDPFCGSGTSLIAAHQEGVTGLGMEISPAYCQIALKRWANAHPDKLIAKLTGGA